MNEQGDTQPPLDEKLDALAHKQRRELLLALLEESVREVPVELGGEQAGATSRETLIAMHHTHLPKLEERGFVRWDRETDHITRGRRFEELEPLLVMLNEYRDDLSDSQLEGTAVLDACPEE